MTDPTTALGWAAELFALWAELPPSLQLMTVAGIIASLSIGVFRKFFRLAR